MSPASDNIPNSTHHDITGQPIIDGEHSDQVNPWEQRSDAGSVKATSEELSEEDEDEEDEEEYEDEEQHEDANLSIHWVLGGALASRFKNWSRPQESMQDYNSNIRFIQNDIAAAEAGRYIPDVDSFDTESVHAPGPFTSAIILIQSILGYSWGNIFLISVPIGFATYILKASPILIFTFNAIGIIPLSGLLTWATEAIASDMGDTVGALLNISFGNLIEIVILVALVNGHIRVVQASLLGSILVNLLLILGTAIIAASLRYEEPTHDLGNVQASVCLLCLSVFSLMIPSAFHHSFSNTKAADKAVLTLSRGSALTLLIVYFLYLFYQLKSNPLSSRSSSRHRQKRYSHLRSSSNQPYQVRHSRSLSASSFQRLIRFADENQRPHVDTSSLKTRTTIEMDPVHTGHQETGKDMSLSDDEIDDSSRGRRGMARQLEITSRTANSAYDHQHIRHRSSSIPIRRHHSHDEFPINSSHRPGHYGSTSPFPRLLRHVSRSFESRTSDISSMTGPSIPMSITAAVILLLVSSALIAFCAEFLVNTIDDMVAQSPLSELFIGLIILPIAGNVAEHMTAMTVAAKNKMDLAINVSVGSSIQIAFFVTPLIVIAGWILDQDMTLYFSLFETVTLLASTFLVNFLLLNGKTNYLEGSLLCACYVMVGVGAYLYPGPEDQSA